MKNLKRLMMSAMLMFCCTLIYAQTEFSGIVVDANGDPIIGASVMEKGTSNGTISDIDGNFKLKAKSGSTLLITYIGYVGQEVKAAPNLKITLKEESKLLNEVVVTGYTKQRKADLTGSVAVVETDALKTSPDADPMRALQGKVPGMNITANGSPSGAGTVRIRGIGSFNTSQDPLFIVDGVPTNSALNSLNANDI